MIPHTLLPLAAAHSPGVGGAYEGAARIADALHTWQPALNPVDEDVLAAKDLGLARVYDLIRNDAYVSAGQRVVQDGIVGASYLLNARPAYSVLGLDETWAAEFQEEVETKFTLAAESHRGWFDAGRRKTLTDIVRLAVGLDIACGEVLMQALWLRGSDRPFSSATQFVEIERLSTPSNVQESRFLRGGVQKDQFGRPTGYHIRVAHPADYVAEQGFFALDRWTLVPAQLPWGRWQVLHLFEDVAPAQTRGVPGLMAAVKEMRIARKLREVTLQNAVTNATFAATIESELPTSAVFEALGAGASNGELAASAFRSYVGSFLSSIAQYSGGANNLRLDGVKIPHLHPGTKLNLQPAGTGSAPGSDFEQSLLRYLAANLGVSYEELSRDYTRTNYSSARAAMLLTWRNMQARKKRVADRVATAHYWLWLEEALNKGEITAMPRNAPSWYEGLNAEAYAACDWLGAARGQIDEMKETQAAVLRLQHNLSTYEDELGRMGRDWRKVIEQRRRENEAFAAAGLPRPDEPLVMPSAEERDPEE
jgi:lambda family phage portal protein